METQARTFNGPRFSSSALRGQISFDDDHDDDDNNDYIFKALRRALNLTGSCVATIRLKTLIQLFLVTSLKWFSHLINCNS